MADVVVIGGGITGAAAAYEIARAGHRVTLVEARRLAAMGSGWTLGGVRQSGRHPAELPLARAAVTRWAILDAELDGDTGYRQGGNLRLARNGTEIRVIQALVEDQRARGLELAYLPDNAAVRAVAPAVGETVLAASFCPSDGHADPVRAVGAFARAAARHGAEIREGMRARAIRVVGGRAVGVVTDEGELRADRVVLAAGTHAPELLAPLGLHLPLAIKLVCVLQTVPLPPLLAPVFGVANADCAGRQEIDGRLRVTTGLGDWPHEAVRWTPDRLQPTAADLVRLIALVGQVLPALYGTGVAQVWGGLIDLTPDALPVLDAPEEIPGLVVAAGFSGHGFGIGPATGEIVADLVLGRAPRFDLAPFRLDRFQQASAAAPVLALHG